MTDANLFPFEENGAQFQATSSGKTQKNMCYIQTK